MSDDTYTYEMTSSSSSVPADCRFGITLQRSMSRYDVPGRAQVWRMRILVTNYYGIDPNIMVYQRGLEQMETGDIVDKFIAIASPVDLEEYSAGAPAEGQVMYRLAEVDLLSKNDTLLAETWRLIKADVEELIRSITYTCELTLEDTFTAGEYPAEEVVPEPTEPTAQSSDVAPVCPYDPYVNLKVTASNDPDFPVDTLLVDLGTPEVLPNCSRQFDAVGEVTAKILVLTTSMINHTFSASLDGVAIAAGGLADEYKAIFTYTRGLGDEYTIEVIGEI